jgi:hypothetical protein
MQFADEERKRDEADGIGWMDQKPRVGWYAQMEDRAANKTEGALLYVAMALLLFLVGSLKVIGAREAIWTACIMGLLVVTMWVLIREHSKGRVQLPYLA